MHVAAIIAAGGRGVRLGADRPKQFLEIQGRSILELSVKALAASDRIDEIVVALPEDHLDAGAKSFQGQIKQPLHLVAGGAAPPGFGRERVCEDVGAGGCHRDSRRRAAVRHHAM